MPGLSRAVYALARTKRRRFLWCVWWTGEPTVKPFRKPDAWGGGATTEEEARVLAERAAGMPLERIDGHWAGAWKRVLAGSTPFPKGRERESGGEGERAGERESGGARGNGGARGGGSERGGVDPHVVLGIAPLASEEELKAAFRKKAIEHHPDHGGSAEAFIRVKRAYDAIAKRRARKRR